MCVKRTAMLLDAARFAYQMSIIPRLGCESPVFRMPSAPIPKDGEIWVRTYFWENGERACAVGYNRVQMSLTDLSPSMKDRDSVMRARGADTYPAADCDGLVYEYYTSLRYHTSGQG
jgi:hypothetical protein